MNTNHVTHNLQLSAWANRIREQQVSGLNIKAWCYQNHFTKDQYYYGTVIIIVLLLELLLIPGRTEFPSLSFTITGACIICLSSFSFQ